MKAGNLEELSAKATTLRKLENEVEIF